MPQGPEAAAEPGGAPEPYLSHWSGRAEHARLPLRGDVVTIGRSAAAGISLDSDREVSRLHARLERVGDCWTVVDDGLSRNGTYVNRRRLTGRVRLHDRDEIRVGNTALTFCAPAETEGQQTMVHDALPRRAELTPAQRAVLVALCRPYKREEPYVTPATNQQIAAELFLTVDAVKTHLRGLFGKFGIDSLPQNQKRTRLVELALQSGLVSRHDL